MVVGVLEGTQSKEYPLFFYYLLQTEKRLANQLNISKEVSCHLVHLDCSESEIPKLVGSVSLILHDSLIIVLCLFYKLVSLTLYTI